MKILLETADGITQVIDVKTNGDKHQRILRLPFGVSADDDNKSLVPTKPRVYCYYTSIPVFREEVENG